MAFWGLKVEPGKWTPFVPPPDEALRLHISQATLGGGIPEDKERIIVKCRAEAEDEEGAQEFNICTIIGGVVESCHLDLIFDGYAEFYVEGSYPVHLTGYFMPDMDDDEMDGMYDRQMGDDEDDDSEDEDEEYDSEDDADDFGVLEDFDDEEDEGDFDDSEDEDEDEDESEDEDDAPKKTKKGGVTIEEIEEEDAKPPAKKEEKKKRAAPEEPPAKKEEPPAKKEKKEEKTPAKKEEKKKEAPKPETPASGGKQLKREFKNGMEILNVAMGQVGGKKAEPGKRVTMKYVGKLQSGKIFDQTKGNATFQFRLGIGEVIKGWDIGVAGMRVGDKRRLTIPPAMAYGKKGVKGAIPGNATLIFDVELVNVQ